jgi:hypothetical protein
MGKHDEAWMILKQVHDTNMRAKGAPEKVFTVSVCLCQQGGFSAVWFHETAVLSRDNYSFNIYITFIPDIHIILS